ncbi:MAG: beta-lactamase family protein, partial [Acidobacteriota bacterium]|nr:beta-lactamase family protein [Acidobacteriota bacterium]
MKTIANTMSVLSAVQPTSAQSVSRGLRFAGLSLLLAFTAGAVGQSIKQAPLTPKPQMAGSTVASSATSATTPTLDGADIGAFLDGLMPLTLERDDIAGAVVSIVKDGKVIFAKGYGYADVKAKKPMSATDTLVRPGSISKLFAWTAVMQQVQAGKIDLDRDVNDYLDFKIPAKFGRPITMRDLMTHSAGFA